MSPSIEVSVAVLDPLILEAAREVDGALLEWALSLSPRERLRACSNATTALGRFGMSYPPRADLCSSTRSAFAGLFESPGS
jgi:hypothetical protein